MTNGAGAIYIFTFSEAGEWIEQNKLFPTEGIINDNFGIGIDYSDHQLGIRSNTSTYLFILEENELWIEKDKLNSDHLVHGSSSIGICKDKLAIGSDGYRNFDSREFNTVNLYQIREEGTHSRSGRSNISQ